jgi:glycosyltransferase involved in cell wall biosynthesis
MINDPNVEFEMWGDRSVESQLILDKEVGDDKRIHFMSPVPQDRKVQLYESFDVFVQAGVYEGIPVMEALSRGVPVAVFRNIQMIPETKAHCFVADDESHMAQIIQDIKANGYNEERKKKAIEYARSFSWRRTAEETVKVYQKTLTG